MLLSKAFIDSYNEALHKLQGSAADEYRAIMDSWHAENPDATVAEVREFSIAMASDVSDHYGGVSSELAAQMFDEVCEEEGIKATAEVPTQLVDPEMVEGAARYDAGKLVHGDWEGFVEAQARKVDNNVRRAAYETVKKSCKDNHVRWARVPSGRETCGYCFMLASRGFVYVDEAAAHAGSHVGCDCTVIPGNGSTEVEGYDPDALYERWAECRDAAGSKDFREIIKEVETRDWDWLWGNKQKPATQAPRVTEFPFGDRVYSGTVFADSFASSWDGDVKKSLDLMYDLLKDAKVPEAANVWASVMPKVSINKSQKDSGSYYRPSTNRVYLDEDARNSLGEPGKPPFQILFHEVGHAVDDWIEGRGFGVARFIDGKKGQRSAFTETGELGKVIRDDWDRLVEGRIAPAASQIVDIALSKEYDRPGAMVSELRVRGFITSAGIKEIDATNTKVVEWVKTLPAAERAKLEKKGVGNVDWLLKTGLDELEQILPSEIVKGIKKRGSKFPTREKLELAARKSAENLAETMVIGDMFDYSLAARRAASDWIEALTGRERPLGVGHGLAYWKRRGGAAGRMEELSSEAFAELFEACMANHDEWDMIEKYFPSATSWFTDKMKEVNEWILQE